MRSAVASSSGPPFHNRSPIRVPSASRPTYQVSGTSRTSTSGSTATSIDSMCRTKRAMTQKAVAKRDHQLEIFARIRIRDPLDLVRIDAAAGIRMERRMERALGGACLERRGQFRSTKISLEKRVGDDEPAACRPVEE